MADRAPQRTALDREPDPHVLRPDDLLRAFRGRRRLALGLGRQQALRVGVAGALENIVPAAALDDFAFGHHADAVGHLAHDGEIVGDEHERHVALGLEALQQVEDLGLDCHIERGGRLVGDQQVRLVGERHGDHHPLALAAGKLVRIAVEPLFGVPQADLAQELQGLRPRPLAREALVQEQRLAHLPGDRVQRVQRGHRLLEDHGDAVAAHPAHDILARAHELLAVEADAPRGVRGRRIGQKLEQRKRGHRLAGAALADQRQGLAALDVEGDAAHGMHIRFVAPEIDPEVLDGQQRAHPASPLRGSKASRTASPMNTSSESSRASEKKAVRPSQGA